MNIRKITSIFTASVISISTSLLSFKDLYTSDNIDTAVAVSVMDESADELVSLINSERTSLGLEPLIVNSYIQSIAQIRANEQLSQTGHVRPNGENWTTIIDSNILKYNLCKENITNGCSTAEEAFETFKNSANIFKDITSADYKSTGIGVIYDPSSEYGWYWVMILTDSNSTLGSNDKPEQNFESTISDFMTLVNDERTALGLEPLVIDPYIQSIAQTRADEQLKQTGHTRPDGTMWTTVIDKNIMNYKYSSENVLRGASTAEKALNAWKGSSGHWANITGSDYKYTGVGIAYDPDSEYGWYWAQIFSDTPSTGYTEPDPQPGHNLSKITDTMAGLINAEREANGLEPLEIMPYLNECAEKRSEELIQNFSHTRPDGDIFYSVIDEDVLYWSGISESIVGASETPEEAFEMLKASPENMKNILNSTYTDMGIGVLYAPDTEYGWYWTILYYEPAYGDLNGDRRVDVFDYMTLVAYIRQNTENNPAPMNDEQLKLADCFKDGMITEADAKAMMKYILDEYKSLPYES